MKTTFKTAIAVLSAMTMAMSAMSAAAYAEEATTTVSQTAETVDIEKAVESKRVEMEQYLLDNKIDGEIATEISKLYAEGLKKRIDCGIALADGSDAKKDAEFYQKQSLWAAQTAMKLKDIDSNVKSDVDDYFSENGIKGNEKRRMLEMYLEGAKEILVSADSFDEERYNELMAIREAEEKAAADAEAQRLASIDFDKVLGEKGAEMEQYLIDNEIDAETAKEYTALYLEGLKNRMEANIADADGSENKSTTAFYRMQCLKAAQTAIKLKNQKAKSDVDDYFSENGIKGEKKLNMLEMYLEGAKEILVSLDSFSDEVSNEPIDISGVVVENKVLTENEGKLNEGIKYSYEPETQKMTIEGDGVLTFDDCGDLEANFTIKSLVIGKNVKLEDTANGHSQVLIDYTNSSLPVDVYAYSGSDTQVKFDKMIEDMKTNGTDVSAYTLSILDGETANEKTTAKKTVATLKGDADLNSEVSLTDVVVVSKNTLSDEAYPLKNEIAFANADMNSDGEVNGVDTSALIENQLGNK